MIHEYPQSKASKGICYSDVQMLSFTLFYISTSAMQGQTELFLKVTMEHQMAVYPSELAVVS